MMPNPRYAKGPSQKPPGNSGASGLGANLVEKSPNWPGVPGKTQPRDRSAGVRKVKQSPKSVGI